VALVKLGRRAPSRCWSPPPGSSALPSATDRDPIPRPAAPPDQTPTRSVPTSGPPGQLNVARPRWPAGSRSLAWRGPDRSTPWC
jgi:hypothetical protein